MLNKMKYVKNIGLFIIIVVILFFNTTPSYAVQYYVSGGYVTQGTNNNGYTQPTLTTTKAIDVTPTSATLTALINGSSVYNTYNLSTWFDYGTTVNLGISSSGHSANYGYASFVSNISGLTPNTVYYFRAMGQSSKGIVYGGIISFRTTIPPIPTVDTNNTVNNIYIPYTPPAAPKATITKTPAVTSKSEATVVKEEKGQTQNTNTTTTASSFLPITILGWILLVILILILILTIKHLHLKFTERK
ncbi:MAG: hypothetical protein Q7K54_00905 [Candidatus Parcubacteria bacterium]|nr:hypothetical protein [Candidatus Parcubacteria bacterium]